MKDKGDKDDKGIIILSIFSLVIIIIIISVMSFFAYKQNKKISEGIEIEKNITKEEEEKEEEKEERIKIITDSKGEEIIIDLDVERKKISNTQANKIKEKVIDEMYKFNFLNAHELLYKEILKYDEDSIPEELNVLLKETGLMSNFEAMLSYGNEELIIEMIKEFKDVDCFLISTLFLDDEHRKYILESADSINPVFDGDVSLIKKEDVTKNYEKENVKELNVYTNIEKVYKHEFIIEGIEVYSYIAKVDNTLRFAKMGQKHKGNIRYYTIKETDELFN